MKNADKGNGGYKSSRVKKNVINIVETERHRWWPYDDLCPGDDLYRKHQMFEYLVSLQIKDGALYRHNFLKL